jgi:hypothetical protein
VANDVFITPRELAKSHIDFIDSLGNDVWLDPCRFNANGSYYSQFTATETRWCEILEGRDFFTTHLKPVDVICCNPPYSILDRFFARCIELGPRVCSFLLGVQNLTARRIEMFADAGYGITKLKMLKIYQWYGMSYIVVFEKGGESIMHIDRKVYR